MHEKQRQASLKVMGVQSYFPRYLLPGAPRPVVFELEDEGDSALEINQNSEQIAEGANKASSLPFDERIDLETAKEAIQQESKDDLDGQDSTSLQHPKNVVMDDSLNKEIEASDTAENKENTSDQSASEQEQLRFQLTFIPLGSKICVLNQLPYLGKGRLGKNQQVLLQNISRSLGLAYSNAIDTESTFRWPMMENKQMDSSKSAARSALAAYLQEKQREYGFSILLILGSPLEDILGLTEETMSLPFQLVFSKSLDEMLTYPRHKKDAWNDFRAFFHEGG